MTDMTIPVSPFILTLFQKRLHGMLYGSLSPSKDILRLLSMYQASQLKLKELVTRTYVPDQINEGYADITPAGTSGASSRSADRTSSSQSRQ